MFFKLILKSLDLNHTFLNQVEEIQLLKKMMNRILNMKDKNKYKMNKNLIQN